MPHPAVGDPRTCERTGGTESSAPRTTYHLKLQSTMPESDLAQLAMLVVGVLPLMLFAKAAWSLSHAVRTIETSMRQEEKDDADPKKSLMPTNLDTILSESDHTTLRHAITTVHNSGFAVDLDAADGVVGLDCVRFDRSALRRNSPRDRRRMRNAPRADGRR